MPVFIPRSPWPAQFPDVVIHGDLHIRNKHPSYPAAKAGDAGAAKVLVEDMLTSDGADQLTQLLAGRHAIMLAVTADEVGGFNAIPDAMAAVLADRLNMAVAAGTIIQANKVGHTRADGWHSDAGRV